MWDGSKKLLRDIKKGDHIITIDPGTKQATTTTVTALVAHDAKNYAISRLVLLGIDEQPTASGMQVKLAAKELIATPNHPVLTAGGEKKAGEVKEGDEILCRDNQTGRYNRFIVWTKTEQAGGLQQVYNIETNGGSTFVMNEVMVLQK
jgi:hypothetical protein